jgi:chloramphenicol 3-O phosphotransferase
MTTPAPIVILNGPPRAGKSSIVQAVQEHADRPWMNIGVDVYARHVTPPHWQPGIGLRPGEERPELQGLIPIFYAALYESIAAHSRLDLAVVADVGHHVGDPAGLAILKDCARRLAGLPVLFVGVYAPLDIIMDRRRAAAADNGGYVSSAKDEPPPPQVVRWQEATEASDIFDLQIDTSLVSAADAAEMMAGRLANPPDGPTAFERLAPDVDVEPG